MNTNTYPRSYPKILSQNLTPRSYPKSTPLKSQLNSVTAFRKHPRFLAELKFGFETKKGVVETSLKVYNANIIPHIVRIVKNANILNKLEYNFIYPPPS